MKELVSLPTDQTVPIIEIAHSFYLADGKPDIAMLDALNHDVVLTEDRPCVLLKFTVKGNCVDYALAFLGRKLKGVKLRPMRLMLFENKSIPELDASGAAKLPTDFTLPLRQDKREKGPGYQAMVVRSAATKFRAERKVTAKDRGVGFSVARGEYLFVYQTVMEGHSYAVDNVLVLGRADTEKYFNFMFPLYAAVRAGKEIGKNVKK
jgi:hypothetical protein